MDQTVASGLRPLQCILFTWQHRSGRRRSGEVALGPAYFHGHGQLLKKKIPTTGILPFAGLRFFFFLLCKYFLYAYCTLGSRLSVLVFMASGQRESSKGLGPRLGVASSVCSGPVQVFAAAIDTLHGKSRPSVSDMRTVYPMPAEPAVCPLCSMPPGSILKPSVSGFEDSRMDYHGAGLDRHPGSRCPMVPLRNCVQPSHFI